MPDALAPGHDLAAVARRLRDQHIFRLPSLALDQRTRGRAADFLVGDIELGDAERRRRGFGANLPKRMIGEIGAALHVVDAGAESTVTRDLERQPLDESKRMHRIEMAQHQDSRCVLPPCRARHQMIAAAGMSGDPLHGGGQAAIAFSDDVNQLVDLLGGFGRGLDLDPAADAFEDRQGVKGIGCGHVVSDTASFPGAQSRRRE